MNNSSDHYQPRNIKIKTQENIDAECSVNVHVKEENCQPTTSVASTSQCQYWEVTPNETGEAVCIQKAYQTSEND